MIDVQTCHFIKMTVKSGKERTRSVLSSDAKPTTTCKYQT